MRRSRRSTRRGGSCFAPPRVIALSVACLALAPAGSDALSGQELPIRTSLPGASGSGECPADVSRPDAAGEPGEAQDLAREATRAALLGDPERARDLLARASAAAPDSPEIAYRRARAHDELDEREAAVRWFCRYLALSDRGEGPTEAASEVLARVGELRRALLPPVPEDAARHFRAGVERLEDERLGSAVDRFTAALEADPSLAGALYNRGLAHGALGRRDRAVADFERYLRERDAPDRERVREAIRFLENPPRPYSATGAFAMGALVPGAGHYYTGRPLAGTLLLGSAVGAGLAAGLYERVEVTCRGVLVDGRCPEGQVASTTTERPALVPGLAVVALAATVSAVGASRTAAAKNDEASRLQILEPAGRADGGWGVRILGPASAPSGGGVAVSLVELHF